MIFVIIIAAIIAVIWAGIAISNASRNRIINNPDFQEVYQRGKKMMSILRRGEVSALHASDFDYYLVATGKYVWDQVYIAGYFEWSTYSLEKYIADMKRADGYEEKSKIAEHGCVDAGIFKDMTDAELFDHSNTGIDALDLLWDFAHVDPSRDSHPDDLFEIKKFILCFGVWPAIGHRPWTEEERKIMVDMLNSV